MNRGQLATLALFVALAIASLFAAAHPRYLTPCTTDAQCAAYGGDGGPTP